jgi:flavodoxin I
MKDDISSSAISAASSKQGQSLHIIFATTSGHTEFVVDTLTSSVELSDWEIEKTLAEKASPQDMLRGAVLLLASSTDTDQRSQAGPRRGPHARRGSNPGYDS